MHEKSTHSPVPISGSPAEPDTPFGASGAAPPPRSGISHDQRMARQP
eukprot:CAMPEP_0180241902 /NCGR_PEP_ID=MMETSP0987-20121128/32921_1 /TAXON_ID=697907 /ORGANISM="non described non described, Strain CCMP2293" /LENGTH=46 /DNA_ID= /DNA_START= /DNA_END= /DNA_ORIENTATION=